MNSLTRLISTGLCTKPSDFRLDPTISPSQWGSSDASEARSTPLPTSTGVSLAATLTRCTWVGSVGLPVPAPPRRSPHRPARDGSYHSPHLRSPAAKRGRVFHVDICKDLDVPGAEGRALPKQIMRDPLDDPLIGDASTAENVHADEVRARLHTASALRPSFRRILIPRGRSNQRRISLASAVICTRHAPGHDQEKTAHRRSFRASARAPRQWQAPRHPSGRGPGLSRHSQYSEVPPATPEDAASRSPARGWRSNLGEACSQSEFYGRI